MKKLRRVLALAALALFLTSCGTTRKDANSVTLTIMGKQTDLEKTYMKRIFEQYEKATGNQLDIVAIEDGAFEQTAAEQFASGHGSDILMHFHNADLERFDVENNFYYLENESWAPDLKESADGYCRDHDGHLLGLPFWESSVSGCYYNKAILDSLGLRQAYTQEEFDMLCQALQEAGYTPICWPADGCSWMMQFALDPIFADDPALLEQLNNGKITYSDIPEVTDMLQWISDAAERGWFGENYLNTGWDDISPVLGSGEAVMTFIWDTWFYTDFEQGNDYTRDDFALMPVFMNTVDGGTYEGGNLNMMMVNKNSENLQAALDFLAFCATPENYNAAFDDIATVSCFEGQTTNIQSQMVTDAEASIAVNERVSTAATHISGYSAEDVLAAINSMLRRETDVAGCVKQMDEFRLAKIQEQGKQTEGS